MRYEIDLRSDTLTEPTDEMRRAMASANVGDDVFGEDPTVNRLQEMAAAKLGKQAALLMTSGTQANLAAILTHCGRGDEVILDANAHTYCYEAAGPSVLGGVSMRPIEGRDGFLTPEQAKAAIRPDNDHFPRSRLLEIENTHNRGGGSVLSIERTSALCAAAHENGLSVHLDGARIFNAAVALGVDARALARDVDSVSFCLSKGLSAPVGSLLCGNADFIKQARRWRKALGGGLRQAGVIAAAGIVAIGTMIERLAEDHENARFLAAELSAIPGISLKANPPPTNMVYIKLAEGRTDSAAVVARLSENGVGALTTAPDTIRFVCHRHIRREHVGRAAKAVRTAIG
ncbi:MAG TPA: low-specificity L-threonine aldolase [Candidatus Brocadiia bacterium]|nr:low-specificity L-threonine aldolase [Candidatus Brocadiia bacterium]